MNLLIIGGSGQLSRRVAELALTQGHEVWTVTRGKRPVPAGCTSLIADRSDDDALRAALSSAGVAWDAAIDCICMNAANARQDLTVLPAYTRRLAVVSTDSVYHPSCKTVPQAEDAPRYMDDGGYGAHKRQMEEAFLADKTSLAWTIFRPGHIFGEGFLPGCFPEQSRQAELLAHMRAGKPLRLVGGGTYLIHPIYVDDMALALLDCLDKPQAVNEIFCIGGPDIVSNRAYYEVLGDILGCPAVIEEIPEDGYLAAHPECSGHLCQRCYCLDKLQASGVRMPDTSLREGLRRQVAWLEGQA